MATSKDRVYIDSCYYIDVARGRHAAPLDPDRASHIPFIENLLLASSAGEIEIYASTLTIAECLFIDKDNKSNIPEPIKQTFMSMLTSGQFVKLVSPDVFISERARDLLWLDGIVCGGSADTIHIATALEMKCVEFITTNRKKGPLQGEAPAKLGAKGMRVLTAPQTAVMPDKYNLPLIKITEQPE